MIPEAPCGLAALIRRIAGLDQRKSSFARMVTAVFIFGSLMGPLVDRAASGQDSNAADKKAAPGEHSDDAAKKPDAPAQLALDLSDGSRVIGTPAIDRLKVTTPYASLDIQLSLIRAIEFSGPNHAQVSLQNGDILNGQLAETEIELKTIFGKAVVPLAQVHRIRASSGGAMPEGLVLHYIFNTEPGAKIADASGSDNDGAVQGGAWSGDARPGGAMSFSGDHQRILIKNSTSLQLQDFSIVAWVKLGGKDNRVTLAGTSGTGMVFGYGQGGYALCFVGSGNLALTNVGIDNVSVNSGITDNVFHHVGVTKKGSKVVFYVDGVARPGPDYNTNFTFDTDAAVAARGDNLDGWLLGTIGEVEVFNRPLSDDEVKAIYDSQKSPEDVENAAKPQPPQEKRMLRSQPLRLAPQIDIED